jgi:anti-sigma regulatory factor (Ser/Thr protein kinase)
MLNSETLGDDSGARWPEALSVSMSADGSHVRLFRRHLSRWLGGDQLNTDVADDLVIATSEALENCCDHAFVGAESIGTMTLTAHAIEGGLVITVSDDGLWQMAGTEPTHRGRGLAMIRALVDEVVLEWGPDGTRLALTQYV